LLWSIVLYVVTFPVMMALLVFVGWAGHVFGVDLGSGSWGDRALNTAYVSLVLLMLFWSFAAAWTARRRGHRAGTVMAALCLATAALFLILPSVL
jgi:hypothetical protein